MAATALPGDAGLRAAALRVAALRAIALPAAALLAGAAPVAAQSFATSLYRVPDADTRLALRDLDGDGRTDLLAIGLDGFAARLLPERGSFADHESGTLPWPSQTVGWYLADLDGDGATEIVLLVDGTHVYAVHADGAAPAADANALPAPRELLVDSSGFLPRGIRRVNIVRDVDGDGRPDLVLPGANRFRIHLQLPPPPAGGSAPAEGSGAAGSENGNAPRAATGAALWAPPISVSFEPKIDLELGDPGRLDARFAQDISIPWFSLQDLDGDGRTDLASETADEAYFHIADPELPSAPDWRLDLAAMRDEVEQPDSFDFDDLLANVPPQVNWKVADLDGVAPNDLVIQQGGKFSVFLGGSHGPRLGSPDQILKASGNVLYFLLRDVDHDGRQDLQILRAQTISLGDAVRLLVVPGSLDFDIFTYRNEGGTFSRKPSTKATVSLRIPALLGFYDTMATMKADYQARKAVPAQPADLDGSGTADDIVDLRGDSVAIWKGRAPADLKQTMRERYASFDIDSLLEEYATRKLDQLDDGGTLSIGIDDIAKLLVTPGWDLRQSVGDAQPDITLPLPAGAFSSTDADVKFRIEDLDGDGRSDVIVMGRDDERQQVVYFLRTE